LKLDETNWIHQLQVAAMSHNQLKLFEINWKQLESAETNWIASSLKEFEISWNIVKTSPLTSCY
jgi:hypothetical protein